MDVSSSDHGERYFVNSDYVRELSALDNHLRLLRRHLFNGTDDTSIRWSLNAVIQAPLLTSEYRNELVSLVRAHGVFAEEVFAFIDRVRDQLRPIVAPSRWDQLDGRENEIQGVEIMLVGSDGRPRIEKVLKFLPLTLPFSYSRTEYIPNPSWDEMLELARNPKSRVCSVNLLHSHSWFSVTDDLDA